MTLHPQQLSDEEVASEIVKAALNDLRLHPASFVDLLIDNFEVKFRHSLTIERAKELASDSLRTLPKSELLALWHEAYDRLPPVYFSRTELMREIRRKCGWEVAS